MVNNRKKYPSLIEAVLPIIVLMILISFNIAWSNDDALSGANQLSLLLASGVAVVIAIKNGHEWDDILNGVVRTLASALPAILILFTIGMLSGSWMAGGIVPTMIYYGLEILHPSYFLPAVVVLCSIVSVAVGSSWSTIATVGVAFLGIGQTLGFSDGVIAGAIISGAYFGDKISPISETTNLAAAVTHTPIFTHIRYMLYTTVPSMIATILIFIGITIWSKNGGSAVSTADMQAIISDTYTISPWLMLVPLITLLMIVKKIPAIPVLFIGSLMGIACVMALQPEFIKLVSGAETLNFKTIFTTCSRVLYGRTEVVTESEIINRLFSTGGMAGMLNTIWLIITAMIFGGILEANHSLDKMMVIIRRKVSTAFGLVTATASTATLFNLTTSDQYISIVMPSRMFAQSYKKANLAPELLSRTVEDSATVTSVLIPWNTCGATQAAILGVATWTYAPFAFFCYISPLMTILYAALDIKIRKLVTKESVEAKESINPKEELK